MKQTLYIMLLLILTTAQGYSQRIREYKPFKTTFSANESTNPFIKKQLLDREYDLTKSTTRNSASIPDIALTAQPIPRDIANLSGKWINSKSKIIAQVIWTGDKWVVIVADENENKLAKPGEIIGEFNPTTANKIWGRLKVISDRNSFKWKEVVYKARMTKLKGKNGWIFWSV